MTEKVITLPQPMIISGSEVTEITIREPNIASMQGLEMSGVIRGDISQLMILIPKISDIGHADLNKISFSNMAALSLGVTSFLG